MPYCIIFFDPDQKCLDESEPQAAKAKSDTAELCPAESQA